MGRRKEVKGTVNATFKLTEETLRRLDRIVLMLGLTGKKVYKSDIVEEALKEKLEKLERELER